ncbi:hypothetical protein BV22DRAFT_1121865 [Leucogyrophana mollusca]|uniref:Uncharacterized protein n=1 Tax=Leucogyrophana mollusca TaxID=85980 RepID=A0ACB8B816_9AGAM|nr:hypothetical protein BV22DRAFT_1121865 [Leucogyrophana mollusca]
MEPAQRRQVGKESKAGLALVVSMWRKGACIWGDLGLCNSVSIVWYGSACYNSTTLYDHAPSTNIRLGGLLFLNESAFGMGTTRANQSGRMEPSGQQRERKWRSHLRQQLPRIEPRQCVQRPAVGSRRTHASIVFCPIRLMSLGAFLAWAHLLEQRARSRVWNALKAESGERGLSWCRLWGWSCEVSSGGWSSGIVQYFVVMGEGTYSVADSAREVTTKVIKWRIWTLSWVPRYTLYGLCGGGGDGFWRSGWYDGSQSGRCLRWVTCIVVYPYVSFSRRVPGSLRAPVTSALPCEQERSSVKFFGQPMVEESGADHPPNNTHGAAGGLRWVANGGYRAPRPRVHPKSLSAKLPGVRNLPLVCDRSVGSSLKDQHASLSEDLDAARDRYTGLLTTTVLVSSNEVFWVAGLDDGPLNYKNPKGQSVGGYAPKYAECGECHSVNKTVFHHPTGLYFGPDDGRLVISSTPRIIAKLDRRRGDLTHGN